MDEGERVEDEPHGLEWGVVCMDFVHNEGLPEAASGELAVDADTEESDEEVVAEELPPIDVDDDGSFCLVPVLMLFSPTFACPFAFGTIPPLLPF